MSETKLDLKSFGELSMGKKFVYIDSWGVETIYIKVTTKTGMNIETNKRNYFSSYDIVFLLGY